MIKKDLPLAMSCLKELGYSIELLSENSFMAKHKDNQTLGFTWSKEEILVTSWVLPVRIESVHDRDALIQIANDINRTCILLKAYLSPTDEGKFIFFVDAFYHSDYRHTEFVQYIDLFNRLLFAGVGQRWETIRPYAS